MACGAQAAGDHPSQWHKDSDAGPFVGAQASATPEQRRSIERRSFATLWISLADLSEESGGLTYATASHQDACTFWECELPCESVDGCYTLHTADDLRMGDATLHTGATFHYSGANTSPDLRPALGAQPPLSALCSARMSTRPTG